MEVVVGKDVSGVVVVILEDCVVVDVSAVLVVGVSGTVVVMVEVSVVVDISAVLVVDVSGAVIVIVEVSFVCRCFCCTSGGCFSRSCCD